MPTTKAKTPKGKRIEFLKAELRMLESEPDGDVFRARLKELLKRRGMTQTQLAQITGMQTCSITYYIQGKRFPTAHSLIRMADTLGVDIHYLVGYWDTENG